MTNLLHGVLAAVDTVFERIAHLTPRQGNGCFPAVGYDRAPLLDERDDALLDLLRTYVCPMHKKVIALLVCPMHKIIFVIFEIVTRNFPSA